MMLHALPESRFERYNMVQLPRWVNLDDEVLLDRLTGFRLRLTRIPGMRPRDVNERAMERVAALNRIYDQEATTWKSSGR